MGTGNHRMGCIHPGIRRFRNRYFCTTCKSNVLCNRNLCCRTCTVTGLWTSADTLSGTADTGSLTAAGMLGVDVGQMIMVGAGISIPMLIVVVFYCKYIGKKIYQIPNENGHGYERKEFKKEYIKSMEEVEKLVGEKNLPSFTSSILPIIIPIVLIFVKTFWGLFGTGEGVANTIISLVGEPIFALGVGTIIAIYGLVRKEDNKKLSVSWIQQSKIQVSSC